MAFDLQQFMLGLGGGMMGDPMLPFKMKNMQQAMQQKMEELKMEKEKNDLMAKQMQIHMKVMEHQLKTGQTKSEREETPIGKFLQPEIKPALGQAPMEEEQGASGGIIPKSTGKMEPKANLPFWAIKPITEFMKSQKGSAGKGFGSSKGGIFSKDTGEITTPFTETTKTKPESSEAKLAYDLGIDLKTATEDELKKVSAVKKMFGNKDNVITGTQVDDNGNTTAFSYDPDTGKTTTMNIGKIGKTKAEKPEDLTPAQKAVQERADRSAAAGLRKEFLSRPIVKAYDEFEIQHDTMKEAYDESKKTKDFLATDQAIIMTFNKMMDLKGTVRVEEYNRTPQDMSLYNRAISIASKWKYGGVLNPTDRKAIMDMSNRFNNALKKRYNKEVKDYRELSTMQSFDPNLVAKEKQMAGGSEIDPDVLQKAKLELVKIKAAHPDVSRKDAEAALKKYGYDPSLFEEELRGFK